jgi:hypothetical protein
MDISNSPMQNPNRAKNRVTNGRGMSPLKKTRKNARSPIVTNGANDVTNGGNLVTNGVKDVTNGAWELSSR